MTVSYGAPTFSPEQTALTGLSLGPDTPPQDPVLALLAWERRLAGP
jgi:hypothetical protein